MSIMKLLLLLSISCISYAQACAWDDFSRTDYGENDLIYADNLVAFQRPSGGWSKLIKIDIQYSDDLLAKLVSQQQLEAETYDKQCISYSHRTSTFDNEGTHSHLRFLMRVAEKTQDQTYIDSALKGIDYILEAQYSNGGFPQNYPNTADYGGHITFNDHAMVGVLNALREVQDFTFIPDLKKRQAQLAFDLGVQYILDSQVEYNGKLTAWGQQYDGYNLARGRIYELPSIASAESVGIIKFLKSLEPTQEIQNAIDTSVEWLKSVAIENLEFVKVPDGSIGTLTYQYNGTRTYKAKGYDRVAQHVQGAKPIWSRFYDLDGTPIFSSWDGEKYFKLEDIHHERRINYSWYGYWPENL